MKIQTELGSILVQASPAGWLDAFYRPSDERLGELRPSPPRHLPEEVKLLKIDPAEASITMFPTNMSSGEKFLQPKYTQIQDITVGMRVAPDFPSAEDDILELLARLPSCFAKDYDHGLGFKQGYRHIVAAIEDISDCDHLVVARDTETGIDLERRVFHLSWRDLEVLRKNIDKVNRHSRNAANSVNAATVRNFLAGAVGEPEVPVKFGTSPLRRRFTKQALVGEHYLPDEDHELFLEVLSANASQLAAQQPKRIALVQQELELANLTEIIDIYKAMLLTDTTEADWQQFFSDNPYMLSLGFGYPVIRLQDQAFMGGRDISGKGDKIADFLFKNRLTNNSAIVEIKTPRARLLNEIDFRGGVYAPNRELVEGVSQVLDQKHRFEGEIAHLQRNSKRSDFETYAVHCCLLIGLMPKAEAKRKSLELFRGNSKAVDVVTFDELLEKLRDLRAFLQTGAGEGGE